MSTPPSSLSRALSLALTAAACALILVACSDGSAPTGPGSDDPGSDDDMPGGGDDDDTQVEFDSRAQPGDSARSFLDDRRFSVLALEIDYMEGYRPTNEGLDSLKSALDRHLRKSSITFGPSTSIPAQDAGPYTDDQVRNLEEQYRDHYTRAESDTLWAYFLVVDGKFSQENVVGIAYYNTSMAFFGQTIREISGDLTQPPRDKVEATVFRHEFGHNLGLVNNGIPMQRDHQDDPNGAHCTEEACVMYYAIETTDYFANVFDGDIPDFQQFCTEDMEAQD